MKNFIIRAITGLLFVAVLVGGILYNYFTFGIVFALISSLSVSEFVKLANRIPATRISLLWNVGSGLYLFLAFMGYCMDWCGAQIFFPYLLLLLALFIRELYLKKENPLNNWAYSLLSQFYVALPFALLNVLSFHRNDVGTSVAYNPILPLSVFIFLWLNDTGAYCIGMLIGKHRLFPRISPKKSWEGAIGGIVVAVAGSMLLARYFTFVGPIVWIGLALVVTVFGIWGDLVESLLKRQLGIKDSGSFLPGHGGILDRLDSSLLAIPAAVTYLYACEMFLV